MALQLRSANEGSLEDFFVMHGDLKVGRIGKQKISFTPQWYWTLNGVPVGPPELSIYGLAANQQEAMTVLNERWSQWLRWAALAESGEPPPIAVAGSLEPP